MQEDNNHKSKIPSKSEILKYLKEKGGILDKFTMKTAFGIKSKPDREAVRRILDQLAAEGLYKTPKVYKKPEEKTLLKRAAKYESFSKRHKMSEEEAQSSELMSKQDMLSKKQLKKSYGRKELSKKENHAEGLIRDSKSNFMVFKVQGLDVAGDLLASIEPHPKNPKFFKGRKVEDILAIISPKSPILKLKDLKTGDTFWGDLDKAKNGRYYVMPTRLQEQEIAKMIGKIEQDGSTFIFVPSSRQHKGEWAVVGSRNTILPFLSKTVLVESISRIPKKVRIIEAMGTKEDISLLSAHLHSLPTEFSKEALKEAAFQQIPPLDGRDDVRGLPLITIDGKDSRDFDDAVWAEPASDGGWHIIVAIADVAYYVRPDSALDRDALLRCTSTYFPDQVFPMLPEALSNGLCSLNPNEDRGCLGVHIWIDQDGNKKEHKFFRGLMRSAHRLTYDQVESFMLDSTSTPADLAKILTPLKGAFESLLKAREARQVLELEVLEPSIILDASGKVVDVAPAPRLTSHKLIEEFMVSANIAAAETLEKKGLPCLYRIHEMPSYERAMELKDLIKSFGVDFKGPLKSPRDFNKLLRQVRGEPFEFLVHEMVLRSQSQAFYSPKNIGHFGLNLTHYAHFTSPIRRYADLLVHRALIRTLERQEGVLPKSHHQHFTEWGQQISAFERRSVDAERDAKDRYVAQFFAGKIGETFDAYINGITVAGMFITIKGYTFGGLVPMRLMDDDYYYFKERPNRLEGRSTGKVYNFGDQVKVTLIEADQDKGRMTFSLASSGPHVEKPSRRSTTPRKLR